MDTTIRRPLQVLFLTSIFGLLAGAAAGQSLLTEDFDYASGALETVSSSAWTSNNGADVVNVVSGSLTYPGYSADAGGKVEMTGSEAFEMVVRTFAPTNSGTVYASFLLRVDAGLPGLSGDPFIAIGNYGTARVTVLGDGGDGSSGIRLCISKASVNASCTGSFPAQTTHLIVAAYTFGPDAGDDVASLWVNPATMPGEGSEPAPDVTESTGGDEATLDRVVLEQQSGLPLLHVDGLRVAASWSALPVELAHFSGWADGRNVVLNWQTVSETNNAGFEVQSRTEGDWQAVGYVPGSGTSSVRRDYTHRIEDVGAGRHSFRLKQIDLGGAFAYGPEIEVMVGIPAQFELSRAYPNPFNPAASFSVTVATSQRVAIRLLDVRGRILSTLYEGPLEGQVRHEFRIDGAALASGTYLYQIVGQDFEATRAVSLIK
jgi:hypothetical protein